MLTQEQNDELTQIGPGTPMGALLRQYWYPVCFDRELDEFPVKKVRLLGEDFAAFKTPDGQYGIVARAVPAPGRIARLRHRRGRRTEVRLPRLEVRPRRELRGDPRRTRLVAGVPVERLHPVGQGTGARRPDLRLHRRRAGAGDPALRGVRHGGCPRHRTLHAQLQLAPDHGERRRPVPRRGAPRELLRLHRRAQGHGDARFVREQAREGRLRPVRARHHQAPSARRSGRAGRRLEDRPSARVPVPDVGRRQRRLPDADPGARRRHPHLEAVLHRARSRGSAAARPAARGRLRGATSTTRGTSSSTTSRARTSWRGSPRARSATGRSRTSPSPTWVSSRSDACSASRWTRSGKVATPSPSSGNPTT